MSFRLLLPLLLVGVVLRPAYSQEGPPGEGDILLSEIMYAPEGSDSDREYVEVYNATDQAVSLKGWTLLGEPPEAEPSSRDAIDEDVVVESGEFVVLCENPDPEENGGVDCAFDYVNDIDHTNTADYVGLKNKNGDLVDQVAYDEEQGWPEAVGASLEFVGGVDEDNSRAEAWQSATARVGDFAERAGLNEGSPNANAPDGALPVELARFEVRVAGEGARLRWATASESGNAGFEIQRTGPATETWTREAFVDGHGTTTAPRSYRYDTERLPPGTHRFRLRQVDVDGSSRIVADGRVRIRPEAKVTIQGPNPVRRGTTVPVTLRPVDGTPVHVAVYDGLGRRLRTVNSDPDGPTLVRAKIPTTGLAAGTYFVRVRGGGLDAVEQLAIIP